MSINSGRTFVCLGEPPIAGCGKVLTDEERHYYGHACEACARAWGDAIEAWRKGGDNSELDAMFDARPKASEVHCPEECAYEGLDLRSMRLDALRASERDARTHCRDRKGDHRVEREADGVKRGT